MSNEIKPRRGCEVYLNNEGEVVIRQEEDGNDQYVILHHEEVRELIPILKKSYQESLDHIPDSEQQIESETD